MSFELNCPGCGDHMGFAGVYSDDPDERYEQMVDEDLAIEEWRDRHVNCTSKETAMPYREPTSFEKAILLGLQGKRHVYAGTVPEGEVAVRRRRNRVARRSRRINRRK